MKHAVRRFKSLAMGIKELEPYIRNGAHLQTGKPFGQFGGLRSREILANWLLCAVMSTEESDYYFTTDPVAGDGVICRKETDRTWLTEQVMVPDLPQPTTEPLEERILQQIRNKVDKGGAAYAADKTLLVFLNAAGGPWYPNRIFRRLPEPLHFDTVWVMGLQGVEGGEYVYGVTNLHSNGENVPTWRIRVDASFESWGVERIQ